MRQSGLFQLAIYAHAGDHPQETEQEGSTILVCNGQDGKYIGLARLAPLPKSPTNAVTYTPLGPKFADNLPTMQIKAVYLERVATEDLLSQVPKSPAINGASYLGSAACLRCHQEAFTIWNSSAHAHATHTLENVKEDKDPECVACHMVAVNRQSGFMSRSTTPSLENVGCESCHGPASRHEQDPKIAMGKVGMQACLQCHIPQQSPNFDFAKYWIKIKH